MRSAAHHDRPVVDAVPYDIHVRLVGDFAASRNGNYSVAEDLARRLASRGVHVTTTSAQRSRLLRAIDMALSTWRHRRYVDVAIIDVYSGRAFLWAEGVSAVLRRAEVPYVLVLRGGGLPGFARRHHRRVSHLMGSAAAVVALSGYLAEQLAEYGGRIHVIPNPLDLGAYTFRPRCIARPHLLWLRSFHETYNPAMAPRVLARLVAEYPDARLVMVGPDKGDGALARTRRIAIELAVADRIEFVGPVSKDRVPSELTRGDIFLNTPNVDNAPISVLEAMACGICVVSTEVGGVPFLLKHEHNALLVPHDDDEMMADAVIRLCRQPKLAAKLSRAGRRQAEIHSWERVLPSWEALLESLVSEGGR